MSTSVEDVFALLPAYLRTADAEEGRAVKARVAPGDPRDATEFGPLKTLISLLAREAQVVEEQIEQTYDNAFIETCAPWAIPYLGALLGVRGLTDIPEGIDMRARVANALELRSRKGTLRALEQAAADGSGWPVVAVEYWKRLVHAQSMRLTHTFGGTVDLRDRPALARINGPFERHSRSIEVRRIATAGGRWNPGNIGLHVWRLRPYSITDHVVAEVAAGRQDFRFHPLGSDAQLFSPFLGSGQVADPAREEQMPIRISREIMDEDPARFYGPDQAMLVTVAGTPIDVADIEVAHLGDLPGVGAEPLWNCAPRIGRTLIDPVLGRIRLNPNLVGVVRISCHFARPLALGGGEHDREASLGSIDNARLLPSTVDIVTRVNAEGGEGMFLLAETSAYTASGTISVPAGGTLRLVAGNGRFPTLQLTDTLTVDLAAGANLELNGLRLHGAPLAISGAADSVQLIDCTLLPGLSLDRLGIPSDPGAISLTMDPVGASLAMTRCISGPVTLADDVDADLTETILDAGSFSSTALTGATRSQARLDRCTLIGRCAVGRFSDGALAQTGSVSVASDDKARLASADTLFTGNGDPVVQADQRQVGCLRFCYVPDNSLTPRQFRCTGGPAPTYTSTRYIDPDYLMLGPGSPETITHGAENGGEIGAYNRAAHQGRFANIQRAIDDFLRFGHAAGIFHET